MNRLFKLYRLLLKIEQLLLLTLLLAMIVIAVSQILLRNLGDGGLMWADGFTRTNVLWLAMLGAMSGSRQQSHIAIDVVAHRLPTRAKGIAITFNRLTTAAICFAAAWFSLSLVMQEYEYGELAFAAVPNWLCQSILPCAFAVIGLRYAMAIFLPSEQDSPQ